MIEHQMEKNMETEMDRMFYRELGNLSYRSKATIVPPTEPKLW